MARYRWDGLPRRVQEYVSLDAPSRADDLSLRWYVRDDAGISWVAADQNDAPVYTCEVPRFIAVLVKIADLPRSLQNLVAIENEQYQNATWIQVDPDRWIATDKYGVLGDFRVPKG